MTRALLAGALVAFSVGCGGPAPVVTVVAPAPPPPPVVSAAPSTAPSAAKGAAPALDPAANRDTLAIAEAVCPAAIKHVDGKVVVGCRSCLPFAADAPDGKVEVDPEGFWGDRKRLPGCVHCAGARSARGRLPGLRAARGQLRRYADRRRDGRVSPLRKVEGGLIKKVERRDASRWVPVRW
jgi:hypothetical protein